MWANFFAYPDSGRSEMERFKHERRKRQGVGCSTLGSDLWQALPHGCSRSISLTSFDHISISSPFSEEKRWTEEGARRNMAIVQRWLLPRGKPGKLQLVSFTFSVRFAACRLEICLGLSLAIPP